MIITVKQQVFFIIVIENVFDYNESSFSSTLIMVTTTIP